MARSPVRPIDRTTENLGEQGIEYGLVEHAQAFSAASEAVASGLRPENAAKSVLLHNEE